MTDLPKVEEEEGSTEGSNTTLEALRSLAFSGTPNEQAVNFKKHGNDYFKGKRFREAIGFYDKAIEAEPDSEDGLLLSLYLNRAACHLELHNYRSTLRDTSKALGLDPTSSKAFFRAAKALMALNKLVEAVDCCDHALSNDQNNNEVQALKASIVKKAKQLERSEREGKERERRKKALQNALKQAFLVSDSSKLTFRTAGLRLTCDRSCAFWLLFSRLVDCGSQLPRARRQIPPSHTSTSMHFRRLQNPRNLCLRQTGQCQTSYVLRSFFPSCSFTLNMRRATLSKTFTRTPSLAITSTPFFRPNRVGPFLGTKGASTSACHSLCTQRPIACAF